MSSNYYSVQEGLSSILTHVLFSNYSIPEAIISSFNFYFPTTNLLIVLFTGSSSNSTPSIQSNDFNSNLCSIVHTYSYLGYSVIYY